MMRCATLIVVVLIAAACGGDSAPDDGSSWPAVETPTTTAPAGTDEGSPSDETRSTPTTDDTGDDAGTSMDPPTGAGAIVTIGGETYRFALDDGGTCDPDFFGAFRAVLTRVDSSGDPVPDPAEPGITQSISISVTSGDGGVIGGNLDGVAWSAGTDDFDESSIDFVAIDGNRAEGTATFVEVESGETAEGSFEVGCADER